MSFRQTFEHPLNASGSMQLNDRRMERPMRFKERGDTMRAVQPAGQLFNPDGDSVALCVQPAFDPKQPNPAPVDESTLKYRSTYRQQPGLRFTHPGLVGDPLTDNQQTRFGVRTDKGERAGDCLQSNTKTELAAYMEEMKEAQYQSTQREPLGRTYVRGHELPAATYHPEYRFGVKTSSSESAKNLIFNTDNTIGLDSRPKSEQDVTRPIDRGYELGFDKSSHRYGKKYNSDGYGVAQLLSSPANKDRTIIGSERVEAVKSVQNNPLGRTKNPRGTVATLPIDHVFGHPPTAFDEWGAKECLRGAYGVDQQQPDKDLGMTTRRLAKLEQIPADEMRRYGVPTIRADRPAPALRSVADPNNYGNEPDSKGLLYPSTYAAGGISEEDFLQERSPAQVRAVFAKMGTQFADEEFDHICQMAVSDFGALSVDSFRHAWNKSKYEARRGALNSSGHLVF